MYPYATKNADGTTTFTMPDLYPAINGVGIGNNSGRIFTCYIPKCKQRMTFADVTKTEHYGVIHFYEDGKKVGFYQIGGWAHMRLEKFQFVVTDDTETLEMDMRMMRGEARLFLKK